MYISELYLNQLSTIPYIGILTDSGIPDDIKYEYLKRYRKKLSIEDIVFFMDSRSEYSHHSLSINRKIIYLIKIYGNFDFDLTIETILKLHEHFVDSKSFIEFLEFLSSKSQHNLILKEKDIDLLKMRKTTVKDFVKLIHYLSKDEIFVGDDVNIILSDFYGMSKLLDCRSYKIYLLTNDI